MFGEHVIRLDTALPWQVLIESWAPRARCPNKQELDDAFLACDQMCNLELEYERGKNEKTDFVFPLEALN